VNVHPAKTEVRFRQESDVFRAVLHILQQALDAHSPAHFAAEAGGAMRFAGEDEAPRMAQGQLPPLYQEPGSGHAPRPEGFWGSLDKPRLVAMPERDPAYAQDEGPDGGMDEAFFPLEGDRPGGRDSAGNGYAFEDRLFGEGGEATSPCFGPAEECAAYGPSQGQALPFPPPLHPHDSYGEHKAFPPEEATEEPGDTGGGYPIQVGPLLCLGQIADSYLILRDREALFLMDQHAAHERALLHAIQNQAERAQSQILALPETLPLHPEERERLGEVAPQLAALGYDLALAAGEASLSVLGVPPLLGRTRGLEMLRDILCGQTDGIDDVLHLMACRSAIKAGQLLAADEAAALLRQWLRTPEREFCPHGRPVILRFGARELEKLFKRTIG
jgi:DNA mismatch repair protein MutL